MAEKPLARLSPAVAGIHRVLVLHPPLLVPPRTIDAPQLAFVGGMQTAGHLQRRGLAVTWWDACLRAAPTRLPDGWLRLGGDSAAVLEALRRDGGRWDLVVITHPPWARLERNLQEILTPLLQGLRDWQGRQGQRALTPRRVLADAALSDTHYVTLDPAWLFARFPALDAWIEREPEAPLDALLDGVDHARLHRRDVSEGARGEGDGDGEGGERGADAPTPPATQVTRWSSGLSLVDPAAYARWLAHEDLSSLQHDRRVPRARFPLLTSRGCPHRCTFCTSERRRPWVPRDPRDLRRDLARLRAGGIEEAVILDPIANARREPFLGLLRALEAAGLRASFPNGLRADRLGPEECARLARLTDGVPLSVETADPDVMASLGKGLSLAACRRALELAHAVGLPTQAHYLIGLPGEPATAVNRTLTFAFEARRRWGAEPLIQAYVPPAELRVPTARGEGLSPVVYEAFHEAPRSVPDALPAAQRARFLDSARRRLEAEAQAKLVINVSYRCNNRCRFCSVGDRQRVDGRFTDQLAALQRAADRGVRLLDLDGGEPTLYPRLPELIDEARARGFETITVTTNARMLTYRGLVRELARRGVHVLVSLHGPDAAVHEGLTRAEGSFAQTWQGLEAALAAGLPVGVNTTVVRESLPHLDALARRLREAGVTRWNVQNLTPFGEAIGRADLAPPWEEARPVLRRLLRDHGDALGLQLVGLPPCQQEELGASGLQDHHKAVRQMLFVDGAEVSLGDYLDARRTRAPECEACTRQVLCAGHWDFATGFRDAHTDGPAPHPAAAAPGAPRAAAPDGSGDAGLHHRQRGLTDEGPVRLLDLIPGYACNLLCDYCSVTAEMRERNLSYREILPLLREGRRQDIHRVGFGGGEPTLRPDFVRLVRAARRLGYRSIKAQSNGLRFADPAFTRRAVEAGLDLVHVSFMTAREALYDRITGLPGSMGLVEQAVANLREAGVTVRGDVILKADTFAHVDETVAYWHARGVDTFYLWLVSLTDRNRGNVASLRPVSEMRPHLARAFDYGRARGIAVMSRHIPACQLPGYEDHVVRLGDEDVWVVTPESSFWLLESAISANRFVDACGGCVRRGICWGVREDYLARYGEGEIRAVAHPPAGQATVCLPRQGGLP